jgi:hypothetical protein
MVSSLVFSVVFAFAPNPSPKIPGKNFTTALFSAKIVSIATNSIFPVGLAPV